MRFGNPVACSTALIGCARSSLWPVHSVMVLGLVRSNPTAPARQPVVASIRCCMHLSDCTYPMPLVRDIQTAILNQDGCLYVRYRLDFFCLPWDLCGLVYAHLDHVDNLRTKHRPEQGICGRFSFHKRVACGVCSNRVDVREHHILPRL